MKFRTKMMAMWVFVWTFSITNDLVAQHWHGHGSMHGHHGPIHGHHGRTTQASHFGFLPIIGGEFCSGCGHFGCFDPNCFTAPIAAPPVIVFNVVPNFRHRPAVAEPIARGPIENFADKPQALNPNALIDPGGAFDALDEIRRRVRALKPSTTRGRERADRLISAGDTAFADQVFARATSRYRDAIASAPDYPEAHFRLAHAYVATRQYNLALKNALIALELAGTSRRDGFSLAEMYRGNKFARQGHDEKLLDAALREPEDGGLSFLIGFTLHYGGNPLKARQQFLQSAQLPGAHQAYVRHFLPLIPVAEADVPAADRPVAEAN